MQTMKKKREILAIPHRIHAMVKCTLSPNGRKGNLSHTSKHML